MSKNNSGIFVFIVLLFAIVSFSLTLTSWLFIKNSNYKNLQIMADNWNNGPIIDLNLSSNTCKMGYFPVITNYWPGITDGCDCSNQLITIGNGLTRGYCKNNTKKNTYCINIPSISPIQYKKWGDKTLCGKRINYSYLDLSIESKPENCSSNTRSCGIIDTLSNVLCIPKKTDCPINKIIIKDKDESPPTDFNYKTLNINDNNKIIYYTNENHLGKIISNFKVSEDKPCLNVDYNNRKSTPYYLDNDYYYNYCPKIVGDYKYDKSYDLIDLEPLNDLYHFNNIDILYHRLPYYKKPTDITNVGLYAGVYDGLKKECKLKIKNSSTKEFLNNINKMESTGDSAKNFCLAAFILSIVIFVLSIMYLVLHIASSGNSKLYVPAILVVIFGVAQTVLCIVACTKINSIPNEYKHISEENCLDSVDYAIVNYFASDHIKSYNTAIAYSITSALCLLIAGLSILFK